MTDSLQHQAEIFQDRFGLKVAARLSQGLPELPHDITERLRAARVQALAHRRLARTQTAATVVASGAAATLTFGDERLGWWGRIASVLPIVVLVVGMVTISTEQSKRHAVEVAEVDTALLTDDLPPAAYTDPGFLQFLKSSKDLTPKP